MILQSVTLWILLIGSTWIYWLLPRKFRDGFLALASYAYLVSLEPVVVTALVAWALGFFYLAPQAMAAKRPKRLILPALISAILLYLAYYKYVPRLGGWLAVLPLFENPVVPLGISYFTFKLIHYAVEVVRGNITDRSLSRFFCYIFLYPIFSAGPIERFDHFVANREDSWHLQSTVEGTTRIVQGLIKMFVIAQVFIADLLQPVFTFGHTAAISDVVSHLKFLTGFQLWGYLAASFLYAYMEFSAYSDIAIGAGRLYGFRIMENFNYPILACNITEFWRRWHMTLVAWCQSYVYLPAIGLTRRPYVAVYCTFLAMGLWHAGSWNWVLWGLYHATGVSFYLTWGRIKRRLGWQGLGKGRLRYAGIPLTFAFVTGSYAFSTTAGLGGWAGVRVFAKLAGFDLGLSLVN